MFEIMYYNFRFSPGQFDFYSHAECLLIILVKLVLNVQITETVICD